MQLGLAFATLSVGLVVAVSKWLTSSTMLGGSAQGISLFYEQPLAVSRPPPPNQNGTIAKGGIVRRENILGKYSHVNDVARCMRV